MFNSLFRLMLFVCLLAPSSAGAQWITPNVQYTPINTRVPKLEYKMFQITFDNGCSFSGRYRSTDGVIDYYEGSLKCGDTYDSGKWNASWQPFGKHQISQKNIPSIFREYDNYGNLINEYQESPSVSSGGGYVAPPATSGSNDCRVCNSSGKCSICGGSGVSPNHAPGIYAKCGGCGGTGQCRTCGGRGYH